MFADQRERLGALLDEKLRPARGVRVACAVAGVVLIVAGARQLLGVVKGE